MAEQTDQTHYVGDDCAGGHRGPAPVRVELDLDSAVVVARGLLEDLGVRGINLREAAEREPPALDALFRIAGEIGALARVLAQLVDFEAVAAALVPDDGVPF